MTVQVSGVTGQLGVLVPRAVVAEEGVTELALAKEEPRAWAPRERLKSVKYRIAQLAASPSTSPLFWTLQAQ